MDETLIVHVEESEAQEQEQTRLLKSEQTQNHEIQENGLDHDHDHDDTDLDKTLQKLELFLTLLGFNQSSVLSFVLSWVFFLLLGVLLPMVMLELSNCPGCESGQIKSFELDILVSQALLAAASLLCLSHNLRKYGFRKFLFVDRYSGHIERFSHQYHKKISVSSVVQVVGVILCLNAAAKISHRAQGIGSIASRWHALATCTSGEASQMRHSTSMSYVEAANRSSPFYMNFSESDLESVDFVTEPTNTQLASYMSSYQKRQALVMFLQNNPGGITIFGWTVDRGLINTIFFIELTVVTFILGKTIVFTGH